jgi:hypothetical protein
MDPRPTLLDTTLNVNIAMQDAVANHFCDDEGPSVDTHPSTRPRSRPKSTRELVSRFEALSVTVPVSAATTPATAPRRLERAPSTKAASQSASAAKTAPSQPERAPNGKATSIQRTPSKTLPALPKEPLATQPSRFQKSWQNLLGVLGRRDAPTDTRRAPQAPHHEYAGGGQLYRPAPRPGIRGRHCPAVDRLYGEAPWAITSYHTGPRRRWSDALASNLQRRALVGEERCRRRAVIHALQWSNRRRAEGVPTRLRQWNDRALRCRVHSGASGVGQHALVGTTVLDIISG